MFLQERAANVDRHGESFNDDGLKAKGDREFPQEEVDILPGLPQDF